MNPRSKIIAVASALNSVNDKSKFVRIAIPTARGMAQDLYDAAESIPDSGPPDHQLIRAASEAVRILRSARPNKHGRLEIGPGLADYLAKGMEGGLE